MKTEDILKNEKASSMILSAVLLPVFVMLIAFVIDIGGSMMLKEELYKACLISAEETSKAIDLNKAQTEGLNNLNADFEQVINDYFQKNFKPVKNASLSNLDYEVIDSIENPKYILVAGQAQYKTFFLKIIGIENINVHSQAQGRLRRIK
ncbi:MAG: hypothetical protein M1479_09695 [Actinobacteria bacterium]|nr:hypothetical protein [Actinomycetota bacterium]